MSNKFLPLLVADDTNVFLTGRNVTDLINLRNEELLRQVNWLQINKLSLNVSKTNSIMFCSQGKHCVSDVKVNINGETIQLVNSTKFLEVIIDKHLLWHDHISLIQSKLLVFYVKARKVFKKTTLLTL